MGQGCCSPVQFLSSLLSEQSRYPSQRSVSRMHASPSSHLKPLGHERLLGVAAKGTTGQGSSLSSAGMFAGGCMSGMGAQADVSDFGVSPPGCTFRGSWSLSREKQQLDF